MSDENPTTASPPNGKPKRRKLKALIITMPGSARKAHMEALFGHPRMREYFEPPAFSDGIVSRQLKNRFGCLSAAREAGLIPDHEWEVLERTFHDKDYPNSDPERYLDCLQDVPVLPGRRGSPNDAKLHYSVELWRKAKTINRGRAVMACTFAHLIALKRYHAEGFDIMLEDNVRAPPEECAHRVWESMRAMEEWEQRKQQSSDDDPGKCHLRFLGWLGSVPNLKWILERHAPKRAFRREDVHDNNGNNESDLTVPYTIVPFPKTQDILEDLKEMEANGGESEDTTPTAKLGNNETEDDNDNEKDDTAGAKTGHTKPGGNPVWGSYAYWISKEGYDALLSRLQNDVGALLWKGKRMRFYIVKPADKILPRILMDHFGRQDCVQLSTYPAFFRAPMLTSKIHTKWDPEFCMSTETQLTRAGGLTWSDLWLTEEERAIIAHRDNHGEWITLGRLLEMRACG